VSNQQPDNYTLGRSEGEMQRLMRQAARNRTTFVRFLEDAGVTSGMKVLDVGTGAGDLAFVAAERVGASGSVVGIDMNEQILETARMRSAADGLSQVSFVHGRIPEDLERAGRDFDAVIGHRVAMYFPDCVKAMRGLAEVMKSGAVMGFLEVELSAITRHTFPHSELSEKVSDWITRAVAPTSDINMGSKLYSAFIDAGFPPPEARGVVEAGGAGSMDSPLGLVRTLRESMIRQGIATEAELDLDAIAEQLRFEGERERTFRLGPLVIGAWSRKP